jgi:hypothetical protein
MPALAKVLHMSLWRSVRAVRSPHLRALRLEEAHEALAHAESLLEDPVVLAAVIVLRPAPTLSEPAPIEEEVSPWDPGPTSDVHLLLAEEAEEEEEEPAPIRDEALIQQEINGAKTLLLEIIRRSAFDYVLYRTSRRMVYKALADQAYHWLFLEKPGTREWDQRQHEGKYITSFEAICEALDLDADNVRAHVRKLTPKHVTSVGRPAEYRRRDVFSSAQGEDDAHALPNGMIVESNPSDDETIY